jgi:signal transduction histidine kinase
MASFEGETSLQWIIRDISERKNLERLRNDLISMIYHDLRSPLGNIVSSLDVFSAMLPEESDPAFRSLINIALRSTERIQRLTDSLLDMNRLESGHPIINSFAVSPLLLARDAYEAVSPVAENKQQKITISIPTDIPPILVDADMIRRVLINLLENAVKYSPPGGEIELGARLERPSVLIWVRDSGPGISSEDQARIFEKYTRLTYNEAVKGFGLGLAYCRLAVEGHGGRIWVESEVGKGAVFYLTLPLAHE